MDELVVPYTRGARVITIVMAVCTVPGLAVITFGISIVAGVWPRRPSLSG